MDGSALPPPSDDQPDATPIATDTRIADGYDTGTYAGSVAEPAPVALPRISDYWPEPGETPYAPEQPVPPRRRRRLIVGAAGAALLFAVGAGAFALTRSAGDDDPAPVPTAAADPGIIVGATPNPPVSVAPAPTSAATTTAPPASAAPSSPPAAPPGPAFAAGTFVMSADLTELNVTLGRPPGNGVARVGSPAGSGVEPDADLDGTSLELTAEPTGEKGSGRVDVVLDERIAWTVRMAGGVKTGTFAMAGGRVGDLSFDGGADRLELTLPRQARPIEIRMAGGVNRWRIGTDGEFPVKVEVRKGAGEIDLNGDRDRGVDRGETLRSRGSDEKSGGLRIEAVAGIGSLTVAPIEA